jgi:hypothetical protein
MAVFQLAINRHTGLHSKFIDALNLHILNTGTKTYDVLIIGYRKGKQTYLSLSRLEAGTTLLIPKISTHQRSFILHIITTSSDPAATSIEVSVLMKHRHVATASKTDFDLLYR